MAFKKLGKGKRNSTSPIRLAVYEASSDKRSLFSLFLLSSRIIPAGITRADVLVGEGADAGKIVIRFDNDGSRSVYPMGKERTGTRRLLLATGFLTHNGIREATDCEWTRTDAGIVVDLPEWAL